MAVMTAHPSSAPAGAPRAREQAGTGTEPLRALGYTALGLAIPAAAFLVAWGLHGSRSSTYRIDSQWSAFAGLFILALAIERALVPFSRKLGPDTARHKEVRDRALAGAAGDGGARGTEHLQRAVDASRRLTSVVTWGVATGLGFLLCAELNITLLQAIRAQGSGQPPFWADLLVTGLVVGAGTKPLHDVISHLERRKNARQDPPRPAR